MAFVPVGSGVAPPPPARHGVVQGALLSLCLTGGMTLLGATGAWHFGEVAVHVIWAAALMFALMGAFVLRGLPLLPHDRFGPANAVTTLRAGMTVLVGAMILASGHFVPGASDGLVWVTLSLAGVALSLDGVDGWLARRSGLCSRYGARFDMEIDAALILILSIAAWQLGKAGPWVLGIGLIRYGFVAAQAVTARLRADLPPSFRRKAVCVLQVVGLCLVALPPVPAALSAPLAGVTLLALYWSFARDIHWLLVQPAPRARQD